MDDAGYVVSVEPGVRLLKLSVANLSGHIIHSERLPAVASQEPVDAVAAIWAEIVTLMETARVPFERLRGIAVGLPASVEYATGRVVMPSFMQSWNDAHVPQLFRTHTTVPVLVENDANLVAISELSEVAGSHDDYFLAVLLGRRIGGGLVANGEPLRGFNGAAGEFGHTPVAGPAVIPCVCSLDACLESVASGAAVAARLSALGHTVDIPSDIVALGRSGDPRVLAILREAGTHIGAALASNVNFFNPRRVVLGGALSLSSPLVAALRAELFQKCLPIAAQDLDISAIDDPDTAGARGALRLLLDEVLAPARIDELAQLALVDEKATS
ncbi:ROK family protein [Microbacterium sp. EST19A]|uniref:ROK family protein n=1 Tax=Microbacterium sp. EST19A TaxID=2862681 RepID=UPI001CC01079|nr:ROK family protein [Microbacterium sp. EST19A]